MQDVKNAPDSGDAHGRNDFSKPRLSFLPIHRKVLISSSWDIWFSLINNNLLKTGLPLWLSWYKESTCNGGDQGTFPGLGRSPGEGKGYSSQSMASQSQTQLNDFHFILIDYLPFIAKLLYNLASPFSLE